MFRSLERFDVLGFCVLLSFLNLMWVAEIKSFGSQTQDSEFREVLTLTLNPEP